MIYLIIIYTLGFAVNLLTNAMKGHLLVKIPKAELLWHIIRPLWLFVIGYIIYARPLVSLTDFIVMIPLWITFTFVMALFQKKDVLYYGNGANSPDEIIFRIFESITGIKHKNTALTFRIILLTLSIYLIIKL